MWKTDSMAEESSAADRPIVTSSDISGVDSKLIDTYGDMLKVEPVKRSRLVKIAISAPNPVLAAEIANAHAEAYVRQGFTLRAQANEGARKFLRNKVGGAASQSRDIRGCVKPLPSEKRHYLTG